MFGSLSVLAKQSEHLPQRFQIRRRFVAASEVRAKIRARHPSRNVDDRVIDFEFETGQRLVSHLPHDPSLLTVMRV